MVDTIAQGNGAEAAILHALVDAGLGVLVPFGNGLPFDLAAVAPGGQIVRLQVKSRRVRDGSVRFNSCSTDHGRGRLDYRGRADLIAVHVASLSRVFVVPVDECPSYVGVLRLTAPRNNQRQGIRFAEDYSLEVWVESLCPAGGRTPHRARR
jgi:PD-(D/E)XK nuclease superfamily protein